MIFDGEPGVRFVVWAPHAREVTVVGNFNAWGQDGPGFPLERVGTTGVWCGFVRGLGEGDRYKYAVVNINGQLILKTDPHAVHCELRPNTASIVAALDRYRWQDREWMERKANETPYDRPMLIYEVHLASWRMDAPEQFRTYEQLSVS